MATGNRLKAQLSLAAGKYSHPPNVVLVPSGRKTFKIPVSMTVNTDATSVVNSPENQHTHLWVVLDQNLKQVMGGEASHGRNLGKKDAHVTHMVMGGAENPDDFDIELTASKLKSGSAYTLVCKSYGVLASTDFVALAEPKKAAPKKKAKAKRKAAPKKKATPKKRKAAPKKKSGGKKK